MWQSSAGVLWRITLRVERFGSYYSIFHVKKIAGFGTDFFRRKPSTFTPKVSISIPHQQSLHEMFGGSGASASVAQGVSLGTFN